MYSVVAITEGLPPGFNMSTDSMSEVLKSHKYIIVTATPREESWKQGRPATLDVVAIHVVAIATLSRTLFDQPICHLAKL